MFKYCLLRVCSDSPACFKRMPNVLSAPVTSIGQYKSIPKFLQCVENNITSTNCHYYWMYVVAENNGIFSV